MCGSLEVDRRWLRAKYGFYSFDGGRCWSLEVGVLSWWRVEVDGWASLWRVKLFLALILLQVLLLLVLVCLLVLVLIPVFRHDAVRHAGVHPTTCDTPASTRQSCG